MLCHTIISVAVNCLQEHLKQSDLSFVFRLQVTFKYCATFPLFNKITHVNFSVTRHLFEPIWTMIVALYILFLELQVFLSIKSLFLRWATD